jgi:hypothetical protein
MMKSWHDIIGPFFSWCPWKKSQTPWYLPKCQYPDCSLILYPEVWLRILGYPLWPRDVQDQQARSDCSLLFWFCPVHDPAAQEPPASFSALTMQACVWKAAAMHVAHVLAWNGCPLRVTRPCSIPAILLTPLCLLPQNCVACLERRASCTGCNHCQCSSTQLERALTF